MISRELTSSWSNIGLVVLSSGAMLFGIIAYTRAAGLRTFSKMSAFDFVITVAFGSLLASVTLSGSSLVEGLVAAGTLLGLQVLIALGRRHSLARVVDNTPLLLVDDGEVLEQNLRRARVTRDDLRACLRAANVCDLQQVQAVVFETTGDISVLHGTTEPSTEVMADVRR